MAYIGLCVLRLGASAVSESEELCFGNQARWYLRAAEGGSTRAMYNTALCFLGGEGLLRDFREARRWMRRAALAGHRKAQIEHGLTLFAVSFSLALP